MQTLFPIKISETVEIKDPKEFNKVIDYLNHMMLGLAMSMNQSTSNKKTWSHFNAMKQKLGKIRIDSKYKFTKKMQENLTVAVKEVRSNDYFTKQKGKKHEQTKTLRA